MTSSLANEAGAVERQPVTWFETMINNVNHLQLGALERECQLRDLSPEQELSASSLDYARPHIDNSTLIPGDLPFKC